MSLIGCHVHLQVGDDLFGKGTVKNFEEHKVDIGQFILGRSSCGVVAGSTGTQCCVLGV